VGLPELSPMKAVAGDLPTADEDGWAFEVKWDGMRVLAHLLSRSGEPTLRLVSANGKDATASFPELAPLVDAVPGHDVLLDGEVVAFRTDAGGPGRPDFSRLQQRMHVSSPAEARRRAADVPVSLVVFDLLHLDDSSLLTLPYRDRRRLLADLLPPGPSWSIPPYREGDGQHLLDIVEAQEMEGVVAKRLDSTYQPGRRSPAWRKVKIRRHQEFVVGGWTPGSGNRDGDLGALLLGVVDDPPAPGGDLVLTYVGRCGSGFDAAERRDLLRLFADLATERSPFAGLPPDAPDKVVRFVRPEVVVEVAFGEWTSDGVLRHPSYLGRRDDKDPGDVNRDP
jgi:bifunctional non-homologous end joining protein LigD